VWEWRRESEGVARESVYECREKVRSLRNMSISENRVKIGMTWRACDGSGGPGCVRV